MLEAKEVNKSRCMFPNRTGKEEIKKTKAQQKIDPKQCSLAKNKNAKLGGATSHHFLSSHWASASGAGLEKRLRAKMTDSPASSLTHRACPFQHSYLRKNFILPSFPRKAKQAGPEMDRSKVGRTFRKRKASPSASCGRQILSLQCVWPRGPKFSGSEFVLKAHLNPESPGRQGEGGGVCTDPSSGPRVAECTSREARKSSLRSRNRHPLTPGDSQPPEWELITWQ